MLSVQSPGCAGMERLGVPVRIGSPPLRDERSRRLRVDSGVAANAATSNSSAIYQHHPNVHYHSHTASQLHDHQIVSSRTSNFMNNHHNHHAQQYHQTTTSGSRQKDVTGGSSSSGSGGSSSYGKANHYLHHQSSSSIMGGNNNLCSTSISRCPYHVALPDGERGPDRDLQIRSACQQSEIPRTYVKAPPNRTVSDVPAQYQSGASSTSSSMSNLNSHLREGVGGSGLMSHSLSGGLGNRATVNGPSALGGGNSASTTSGSTSSSKPKTEKFKEMLRSLKGNKTSKSSSSGINISNNSSNNNNNNNHNGVISSNSSCNNNNNNYRSNPYGNGNLVGSSVSRSGLGSSNGGNHLAVSGIHNHNHHYRQSTASVQQRQQSHQSGLSSSAPNASSGSSLGGSNTPTSLSASPSPDTSTHYM